jgi:hypothetical protein
MSYTWVTAAQQIDELLQDNEAGAITPWQLRTILHILMNDIDKEFTYVDDRISSLEETQ